MGQNLTGDTDASAPSDCLFCKIVAGEIPGDVVHVTERTVAFRDLNPQAPTHVLVVPRDHYPNAAAPAAGDPQASAELLSTAAAVAAAEKAADDTSLSSYARNQLGANSFVLRRILQAREL